MSTFEREPGRTIANAGDCARLWTYLTGEYIPGLRIEICPILPPTGKAAILLEVLDDSAAGVNGESLVNIWAWRTYANDLNLISLGSLFDLLISAHRQIEDYFVNGEQSAPARRVK